MLNGDFKGYFSHLGRAWGLALKDPEWVATAAIATAAPFMGPEEVGMSAAGESGVLEGTASVKGAPQPSPKFAAKTAPNITFKTGHVAQHLKGLGLPAQKVEAAIAAEVKAATQGTSQTGSFWGRVTVEGKTIEYRASTRPDGTINVETYYPTRP